MLVVIRNIYRYIINIIWYEIKVCMNLFVDMFLLVKVWKSLQEKNDEI